VTMGLAVCGVAFATAPVVNPAGPAISSKLKNKPPISAFGFMSPSSTNFVVGATLGRRVSYLNARGVRLQSRGAHISIAGITHSKLLINVGLIFFLLRCAFWV
jgi:hypothetical protein